MSAGEEQAALVPVPSAALTKASAKSLAARGRADLRVREEAEEWLQKGLELHHQQRYEDAFRCFERGIQLNPNHPELQLWLGNLFTNGEGVPQDYVQAATWWRKAAEQGFAFAQFGLGNLFTNGQGVPQDYTQAAAWYRKAAEQGDSGAQHNLGCAYEFAQGLPQDHTLAAVWWRKAAEQGYADAQNDLGVLYHGGDGVQQDHAQAAIWYRKAAEKGHADAQNNLGILYQYGHGVPQNDAMAAAWYRKAAEQGNAGAKAALTAMAQSPITLDMSKAVPLRNPKPRVTPSVVQDEDEIDLSAGFRSLSMATAIELHPNEIEDLPLSVSSSARTYPALSADQRAETIRGFEATKADLQPSVFDEVSGGDKPSRS